MLKWWVSLFNFCRVCGGYDSQGTWAPFLLILDPLGLGCSVLRPEVLNTPCSARALGWHPAVLRDQVVLEIQSRIPLCKLSAQTIVLSPWPNPWNRSLNRNLNNWYSELGHRGTHLVPLEAFGIHDSVFMVPTLKTYYVQAYFEKGEANRLSADLLHYSLTKELYFFSHRIF